MPLLPLLPRRNKAKVFVGLSGGVDSSVSAALLVREGHDVTGVFIKIQIPGYPCPAAQDRIEAMRAAAHLRIPFIEVDLSKEYEREVFAPSIKEFAQGHTPNPDTLCNEKIKFGVFYDFCRAHGAEFVATGHYARTKDGLLYAGTDETKDQSYFLWAVPEEALRHTLFPVGSMRKSQVRALAKKFGLPNAARPDSQGLCFLGDISLEDMLTREVAPQEGAVLDERGAVVGTHKGAAFYTLGQRHGFSLLHETPHTAAQYVIAKNIQSNTITISPEQFPRGARRTKVALTSTNWLGDAAEGPCEARFRYRQALVSATLQRIVLGDPSSAQVLLEKPFYVPLGQSLVLYRGDRCLGGGVISDATLEA